MQLKAAFLYNESDFDNYNSHNVEQGLPSTTGLDLQRSQNTTQFTLAIWLSGRQPIFQNLLALPHTAGLTGKTGFQCQDGVFRSESSPTTKPSLFVFLGNFYMFFSSVPASDL